MGEDFLKRFKELVTFSYRTGKVHFGLKTAKELVSKGYRGFLVLAEDVSPRVEREAFFIKKRGYNVYKIPVSKEELASWFDKGAVGVLFLPNTRLTFKIEKLLGENAKKLPPLRGLKNGEVSNLETKRIRRTAGHRLQRTEKNLKGKFRFKRKGQYEGYGGPKANHRPNNRGSQIAPSRSGGKGGDSSPSGSDRGKRGGDKGGNPRGA
jgi:ribosomal protein L7Ae-like RNA K-turn-binding protein